MAARCRLRHTSEIAVLISLCICASGCAKKRVSYVLTYNVIPNSFQADNTIDMHSVLVTLNDRLGRAGQATASGDRQVQVKVFGHVDSAELEYIKRLITTDSDLEFRITADLQDANDKTIIEQAMSLPMEEKQVAVDGKPVAKWVAYSMDEFGSADQQGDDIRKIVKRQAGDVPEALVLIDPWNVTGVYLASASIGRDGAGRPAIDFSLNPQGAKRFFRLTSENMPNQATGAVRYLGVILDQQLICAPSIRGLPPNPVPPAMRARVG